MNRQLKAGGKPGQSGPASSRWMNPRPPLLRNFTQEIHVVIVKVKTSKAKPPDGDFVAATRGLRADAFFGASPVVASALGSRLGATPRGRFDSNTHLRAARRKGDISILQRKGTFLFCVDKSPLWA